MMANIIGLTNYGPFMFPLREQEIEVPSRFAIGGRDVVLNTADKRVAQRFVNMFGTYPDSSSQVFPVRNHCFNFGHKDYVPFNKDVPQQLVEDVKRFVQKVLYS
jgi:hypothetical protein